MAYSFPTGPLLLAFLFANVGTCSAEMACGPGAVCPVGASASTPRDDTLVFLQHTGTTAAHLDTKATVSGGHKESSILLSQAWLDDVHERFSAASKGVSARIHSDPNDWTFKPDAWISVLTPFIAWLLAVSVHRPSLAGMLREPVEVESSPDSPVWYASLVLLAMALAVVVAGDPEWGAAQTSLFFVIFGYGIVGIQQPHKLVAPLVASYLLAMTAVVKLGGASPKETGMAVAARLIPIEVLSSLPLHGVDILVATFGSAVVCVAASPALIKICSGASWPWVAVLWLWSVLGGPLCTSGLTNMFGTAWLSIPVRLQMLSFAAGIAVRSYRRPSMILRVVGLVLGVRYVFLPELGVPVAWLQAASQGAFLPLQAFLVWVFAAFIAPVGTRSRKQAASDCPRVFFGALFLAPLLAGILGQSFHGHIQWMLVAMAALSCYLVEWMVFYAVSTEMDENSSQQTDRPKEQHFLGRYKKDRTTWQSWAKPVMQMFLYLVLIALVVLVIYFRAEQRARQPTIVRASRPIDRFLDNPWTLAFIWFVMLGSSFNMFLTVLGQIFYPVPLRQEIPKPPELKALTPTGREFVMVYRFTTRGSNPTLVALNVDIAHKVLVRSGFDESSWRLEVVTDSPLFLENRCPGIPVCETVVPSSYKCPKGAKYKARALHYAALFSNASGRPTDWIVHLDEETRFDEHTVCAIYEHCMNQNELVANGTQDAPDMGHGAILYNTNGVGIENYFTALVDTVRVGDDVSKFRFQYSYLNFAANGMHGRCESRA